MYLNNIEPKKTIAFGKLNKDYKSDDIKTRAAIRKAMEEQSGSTYSNTNELRYMSLN